ncbi:MAG: DUF2975 domain-containing protein [Balneolaceae bacterium]
MKLKKDWSLAYFIYYICWLSYWLIGISFISAIMMSGIFFSSGTFMVLNVPVTIQSEQFSGYDDLEEGGLTVNIPTKSKALVSVKTDSANYNLGILSLYAIKFMDGLVAFLGFYFLSRVFKKVAENDPFHFKNATYLFALGWTMFAVSIISIILMLVPAPLLSNLSESSEYHIANLNLHGDFYLIGGILVVVLSYVFKEGARIHEEQKLTV